MEKEKKPRKHFGEPIQEQELPKEKPTRPKHFSKPTDISVPKRDNRGHYAEKFHMDNYVRLKKEDLDPDGVEYLIQAITQKAAFDYKRSKSAYEKKDAEEFFMSDWFTLLTGLDGKYMLRQLDKYELAKFEEVVKK